MKSSANKLLQLSVLPTNSDLALLVLRVWIGFGLFLKHGLEKLTNFSAMALHFPDPIHIGPHASLAFALLSDAICSILIVLGLATRLAALVIIVNLAVAFSLVHGFAMFGQHNGELAFVYLGVFVALLLAGGGRFSIDQLLK